MTKIQTPDGKTRALPRRMPGQPSTAVASDGSTSADGVTLVGEGSGVAVAGERMNRSRVAPQNR